MENVCGESLEILSDNFEPQQIIRNKFKFCRNIAKIKTRGTCPKMMLMFQSTLSDILSISASSRHHTGFPRAFQLFLFACFMHV